VAIKRQGQGVRETFTVRKQSFGVGVERTFPLHSPKIERIEVSARGDVRRAKLYYLRDRVGKAARVRERGYVGPEQSIEPGLLHAAATAAETPPDEELLDGETGEGVVEAGTAQLEGEAASETEVPADGTPEEDGADGHETPEAEAPQGEPDAGADAPLLDGGADESDAQAVAESSEDGDPAQPEADPPDEPA